VAELLHLSLFSGIAGFELGFRILERQAGLRVRTVGYVDHDRRRCELIERRIMDGVLDDAPVWQMDIGEFNRGPAHAYAGMVDIVTAGFPCQPFSSAGRQRAAEDGRNCWPQTIKCIRLVRPQVVSLENVPGLLSRRHGYFGTILGQLAASGYDAEWVCLSAASAGACHIRKRLWILAYSKGIGWGAIHAQPRIPGAASKGRTGPPGHSGAIARGTNTRRILWPPEPAVDRVADGVPRRVDRIRSLGNAVIPAMVASVFPLLLQRAAEARQ